MSRLIDTLAADAPAALAAINTARAAVQGRVWNLAGTDAPDHQATASDPLIIDLDATLITAHSEKDWQQRLSSVVSVTTRSERGLTTAPVAPANPSRCSSGKATPGRTPPLITSRSPRPHCGDCRPPTRLGDQGRRSSSAPMAPAAPNEFLNWLTTQRLTYSVGFTLTLDMAAKLETIPTSA